MTHTPSSRPIFDLTDLRTVKNLERAFGMRARKNFSQHWLVDRHALESIVDAAELTPATHVLEVGAGMGVLTIELAQRAGRVVAVEIERDVWRVLERTTEQYDNVELINDDLLKIDPRAYFPETPYTLVANLPYGITAAAIRHFLESAHPPERMVVLIQKEVAERITAGPGDMTTLALSVQHYATPSIAAFVPAKSFAPPPEVDSAVLVMVLHPPIFSDELERERFFSIAHLTFAHRRKQLHNVLTGGTHLTAEQVDQWLALSGIASDRRAQTLSFDEWRLLVRNDPRPLKKKREKKRIVAVDSPAELSADDAIGG